MTPFPVLSSTISANHLGNYIKAKYGFEEVTCSIFRTGINHTYMVKGDDTKYVFRVYSHQWRTKIEIEEEIRLLNLLDQNRLSVSYPIADSSQTYIQELMAPEGLRYGVLFSFAEGGKIRNLTENMCRSIGTWMAQMHTVTLNQKLERIDYSSFTLTSLPYDYARVYYSECLDEMQFVKKAGDLLTTIFAKADSGHIRNGIVHLDMWYDNMNIQGQSEITVFDFDFCGNGWLILDVAYFCMQLFHTEPDKVAYKAKLTSFFEGYENLHPLTHEEKRLLPYAGMAIWIFYLGVQSQRFENWSNIFLTENYLKHYLGQLKNWMQYFEAEIR